MRKKYAKLAGMSFCYSYPHPAVTVDVAIFTIADGQLEVLLIRRGRPPYQGLWALPGGFVGLEESLKHAAWRELREETGVNAGHLEQLHTFGHPRRDPRERVISVAYFAAIPAANAATAANSDAERADWFAIDRVPELAFDHRDILDKALERIARTVADESVALPFMLQFTGPEFSLPELQRVHEVLTRQPIDRRNFRKRVLAQNVVEPTGEERRDGAHRPAKLYRMIERRDSRRLRAVE